MKVILAYPPCTDPTSAYHSIAYLAPYVRKAGHKLHVFDINLEIFSFLAQESQIERVLKQIEIQTGWIEQQKSIGIGLQKQYFQMKVALENRDFMRQVPESVAVFRDEGYFFDPERYTKAVVVVETWLTALSSLIRPLSLSFCPNGERNFVPNRVADLVTPELLERARTLFKPYLETVLGPRLSRIQPDVVGFSIAYRQQAMYAFSLADWIRRRYPKVRVIIGGTDANYLWKYVIDRNRLACLFDTIDALFVGEAEEALPAWLHALDRGDTSFESIPNVVTRNSEGQVVSPAEMVYQNIRDALAPDYRDLYNAPYWAPVPFFYYSPTRGCYWNRCTFCDYGLSSDRPTSPSRERDLNRVINDLNALEGSPKHLYLAVDAISPRYLKRFCSKIVEASLDVRWGAETRLEKTYDSELAGLLAASGCIGISIGFESGCQRTLDRMDKGIDLKKLKLGLQAFKENGIPVQMMGISDFPGETVEDAIESIEFLLEMNDCWSVGGLGEFTLEGHSLIAGNRDRFGIKSIRPQKNSDFLSPLYYEMENPGKSNEASTALSMMSSHLLLNVHPRPYAGGIDSAHSLLYYERFGKNCFDDIFGEICFARDSVKFESPFDLKEIVKNNRISRHLFNNAKKQGIILELDASMEQEFTSVPRQQKKTYLVSGLSLRHVPSPNLDHELKIDTITQGLRK
ncbi:MAG: B12-binding domain-containing radical SAM protein [Proteobacteria bacterium]|nr:B12-binding domain-containing radical SAM protein [Pseudomonadota bacterium]